MKVKFLEDCDNLETQKVVVEFTFDGQEKLFKSIKRHIHKVLIRWCIRYIKRFYKVGYEYFPESRHHVWRWTDDFEKAMGVTKIEVINLQDKEPPVINCKKCGEIQIDMNWSKCLYCNKKLRVNK